VYNAKLIDRQFALADGHSWLLLDSEMVHRIRADTADASNDLYPFQRMMAALNTDALARKGDSWAELARACNLPAKDLEETVQQYNKGVLDGYDAEFQKHPKYLKALDTAPFYAVPVDARCGSLQKWLLQHMPSWTTELTRHLPLLPAVKLGGRLGVPLPPTPSLTLGGLRVDLEQRVLHREHFTPIHGLYAAGRSAAGIATGGYVSGMSLADAIFSGRHAGRHAALRSMSSEVSSVLRDDVSPHPHLQPVAVRSKL